MHLVVLIIGLAMTAVTLAFAVRRVWFLYRVTMSGQPAPDRVEGVVRRAGVAAWTQVTEVLGQRKLLKWTVPGAAHFFVFWAFLILLTVYVEAYGALFETGFAIWGIGHSPVLGFLQDFIALMCFLGIVTFAIIRIRNRPADLGRHSRFSGSHLSGAWFTLFMIFNVLWTIFLFRGSSAAAGNLPYGNSAFISTAVGSIIEPFGQHTAEILEAIGLLLHIAVMLVFLIFVLHSKHLHIFIAPINVLFGRRPKALGAMKPMMSNGAPVDLEAIEDLDEDTTLGVGKVEDFSWKGILDFHTCTECGRCQSQCPAWNTEKPLSPKMLIMMLRDNANAKAPYLLADSDEKRANLSADVLAEVERPLVGETEGPAWEPTGGAVIDNDVLWSCVSCGACVEQCPVDIEHVDHIMDMRRYQVMVESNFPAELNQLFRGMENKGNPWNMSPTGRMEWAEGLDFPVKVVGEDVESLDEVDWLFWVGCAGAYEDRAKKTTRAVAELLHTAGVNFAVLGNGETCTGDPARRAGNEFIFQGLASQNAETLKGAKAKKVVATCAHCFNTLKNEYGQFGVELEVVHHTQLLNQLVREKKLAPVASNGGRRSITYHDPCYIGRHNQVYSPPRELLQVIPDADFKEMPRNSERSFCCGAGGARMWMEETIGTRINEARTQEAVATGADQIAVACPFCRVMLSDGLTAEQSAGRAREEVEVLDVAQMLLASVKGESTVKRTTAKAGTADSAVAAEPAADDATQTANTITATEDTGPAAKASGGTSLFDTPAQEEPAKPKPAESGGSLFDMGGETAAPAVEPADSGGSLFDVPGDAPAEKAPADSASAPAPTAEPQAEPTKQAPATDLGSGSLFDVASEAPAAEKPAEEPAPPEAEAEPSAQPQAEPTKQAPATELGSGSLFDLAAPEAPAAEPAPTPDADAKAAPATEAGPEPSNDADGRDETATPEAAAAPETAPDEAPAPEESHQPRTDKKIDEGGSLFDL